MTVQIGDEYFIGRMLTHITKIHKTGSVALKSDTRQWTIDGLNLRYANRDCSWNPYSYAYPNTEARREAFAKHDRLQRAIGFLRKEAARILTIANRGECHDVVLAEAARIGFVDKEG